MANGFRMLFSLARTCQRRPPLHPSRRFAHSTAFQVISRRRIHFWSTSEETIVEVETDPIRKVKVVDERKITQAAPDWLPLVPGSSYWIPSEDEKEKPKLELSEEKLTAFISPCGWPVMSDDEDETTDSEDEDDD